ncbi:hypothetical protein B0O99DRAFT_640813 [Bisporella sp. PMI_857]|nr:hypothetical protein B0O99DRAFT_640813 [Bisporella sp. PMI_857]
MDQASDNSGRNLPPFSSQPLAPVVVDLRHRYTTIPSNKVHNRQLTVQEWIALRPVIERLYIHENLTYEQVATILKSRYNFYPTKRQFRRKVLDWGLKKNTTAAERERILDAISTQAISERTRVGTVSLYPEKVLRWRSEAAEKKTGETESSEESSPRNCAPNAPIPVAMLNSAGTPVGIYDSVKSTNNVKSGRQHGGFSISTGSASKALQPRFMQQQRYAELSSPPMYRLPQELFFSIGKYFDSSYQSRTWVFKVGRGYTNIHIETENYNIDKILGSCNTAGMLVKAKSFTEARRVLSAMFGLMKDVIKDEHPDTLNFFLLTFWYLKLNGLEDVIEMLQRYIGGVALVVPKNNPWRRICQIIGVLEPKQFQEAWHGLWTAIIDALCRNLGPLYETTIDTIINRSRLGDLRSQEITLRQILTDCEQAGSSPAQIFTVMGPLSRTLREQGKFDQAEIVALNYLARARVEGDTTARIISLQFCAEAQNSLGKYDLAEKNLREAAAIFATEMADDSPTFVIRILTKLETWMREWPGREADADNLKAEIHALIPRDDTDAEMGIL